MIRLLRRLSLPCASLLALAACGPSGDAPTAPPSPPPAPAPTEPPPTTQPAAQEPAAAEAMPAMPAVPEGASIHFVRPADGDKVRGPLVDGKVAVAVEMGADGIEIKPAGEVVAGSGHHHILIDTEPGAAGEVVPADDQHVHFGKAQTQATLELAPGAHTLVLQLADGMHRSYGPGLSARVAITVEGVEGAPAAEGATAE